MMKIKKGKRDTLTEEKKKKQRSREQNVDVETPVAMTIGVGKRKTRNEEKKKKRSREQNADIETHVTMNTEVEKRDTRSEEKKKKKRSREQNADVETHVTMNIEVDNGVQVRKAIKDKASTNRKRKNKDKNQVGAQIPIAEEAHLEEQNDGILEHCHSKYEKIQDSVEHRDSDIGASVEPCRSKKTKKKRKKEVQNSPEKREGHHQDEVHIISSGDEDCSKGMKKWIMEYHQSRPGLEALQHRIDDFVTAHEEKLEEERKAKEALAAEGGWTVVVHHKGRKKTTESESGIAVGSVAQAAVEDKLSKKKPKEVGLDFYRFQKKEAQRNEIMELQSKFEEDKKRLQQLRASRKFRPY